ncbi:DUF1382 family protein, partial [Bacillus thuringiensis]
QRGQERERWSATTDVYRRKGQMWCSTIKAPPADLRKCLETANMLAHSGIRFVPIPAVTDAEFATLSAIFADKIESLAAEAEMEENQQNN